MIWCINVLVTLFLRLKEYNIDNRGNQCRSWGNGSLAMRSIDKIVSFAASPKIRINTFTTRIHSTTSSQTSERHQPRNIFWSSPKNTSTMLLPCLLQAWSSKCNR